MTPQFGDQDYQDDWRLKKQGVERVLGPLHQVVGQAIIAFRFGRPVALYSFPQPCWTG